MSTTDALRLAVIALGAWALGCSATDARDESGAGTGGAAHGGGGSAGNAGVAGNAQTGGTGGVDNGGSGTAGGAAGNAGSAGTGSAAGSSGSGAGTTCTLDGQKIPEGNTLTAPDGCNTCVCTGGQFACTERACASVECVVARRLDRCCGGYEAVSRSALAADPCLSEEPGPPPDAMRAQDCLAKSPDNCAAVLCGLVPAPSRLSEPDGAGGCRFVDECQTPDDCVIAWDPLQCCGCPTSMPGALLAKYPCLAPEGSAAPAGELCPACSLPVLCGACAAPPAAPSCVIGDALNRCE